MAYTAQSGGRTYRVDVHTDEGGLHVHLDDQAFPIDVLPVGPALYSILLNGRSYEVDCVEIDHAWIVLVDGQPFQVVLQDERVAAPEAPAGRPAREGLVTAPMPGRIVKLHVSVGERVLPGAPVCVLEAMKMENELTAAAGGTVAAVHIAAGETVKAGQVLVELWPAGAEPQADAPAGGSGPAQGPSEPE
jgi:glutaconyl-CoA/methylmalonyl-CoA decarboxylase subunit gamma